MYFKKILLAVALIGLAIAAYFAYFVYGAMFSPNTNFDQDKVIITIPSNSNYSQVRDILKPYLKDIDGFDALANRKKYAQNVKNILMKKLRVIEAFSLLDNPHRCLAHSPFSLP